MAKAPTKKASPAVQALKKPAAPSVWTDLDGETRAMAMPGGVVIAAYGAMVFVPGAVVRKGEIR